MTIPYTVDELELVAKQHVMDLYHRELLKWAAARIRELEKGQK